jgi:hypothetical protein
MILGIEWYHIVRGLCVVWMVGSALLFAWFVASAPIDPPWGE